MRVEIPNAITVTIGGLISRGVRAVAVTEGGRLAFTLTDGSTVDLGSVVGPQGPRGETGAEGPKGETAPSIYAQQGKCRNHAAFSTLQTIKQPL